MATQKDFGLFVPKELVAAVELLTGGDNIRRFPLVRGRNPGKHRLQHALFPPDGIERRKVPAQIAFFIEQGNDCAIDLTVCGCFPEYHGHRAHIIGFVSIDQCHKIGDVLGDKVTPSLSNWVAIHCDLKSHEGIVLMFRETAEWLKAYNDALHDLSDGENG